MEIRSERIFLGWTRPILHSVADRLVASVADRERLDLSDVLLVLPGSRAGRRLLELLLDRSERDGRPLRPPRITTVGRLPEEMYHPELPIPNSLVERLAWRRALEDLDPLGRAALLPDEFWPKGPGGERTAVPPSLEDTIRSLHEEVGAVGTDFAGVRELHRRAGSYDDGARWDALATVQRRFRDLLERTGFIDRESSRRRALDRGILSLETDLWIVGAADLPGITREFLAVAASGGVVRLLVGAPPELSHRFDEWGCVRPEAWEAAMAEVPDGVVRVVGGPIEQAAAAINHLASLDREISAEQITIGVPDQEVVPYLTERLGEMGVRVRNPAGFPVEHTGIYRLLDALARYSEHGEFRDFADLVRVPMMEGALRARMGVDPGSLAPYLDRYQRTHLQARMNVGFPVGRTVRDQRDGDVVLAATTALSELFGNVGEKRGLADWGPSIAGLLADLLASAGTSDSRTDEHQIDEVAGKVASILDRFSSVPDSIDREVPAYAALRMVLDELRGEVVPPGADDDAIELLGWLELPLDDAPVMTLTGFNEPHVPQSTTVHPFLPDAMRRDLGLLDNRGRWARDLLNLRTILESRSDVRIIAGRRSASGDPTPLSRLLLAEEPKVVARRIIEFLGEDEDAVQAPRGPTGGAGPGAGVSASSGFDLPADPVLSNPLPPTSIPVTAFRAIIVDSYRYALERILRLERVDDRIQELDPLSFGSLAHLVLQDFGESERRSAGGALTDPDEIRGVLHAALERRSGEQFGVEGRRRGRTAANALPAVRIQIEQLRARLDAFAQWQAEWASEGWRIRAVEASPPDGVPFDADGEAIRITGKIDRVDQNERTGEWCVFDYKTGSRVDVPEVSHRRGRVNEKEWVDLQLPLYRLLAAELVDPHDPRHRLIPPASLPDMRMGYIAFPRDPTAVGPLFAHWSADELAQAMEVAREVVESVRRNRFAYDALDSSIRVDEDLAVVVGRGLLVTSDPDPSENDDD